MTGIDTLEIGIDIENYKEHFFDLLVRISEAKDLSQKNMKKEIIDINDTNFEVSPKGQGFYMYKIENREVSICFMSKRISNTPPIYVRFFSTFLWEYGYKNAYDIFMKWFENFNAQIVNVKIGRIDICLDTDEVNFEEKDVKSLFSRAKKLEQKYVDDIYKEGKIFSGFVIGKGGNLSCRIYNKTLEIKNSNKIWFEDIWKEFCWLGDTTVWRIEFQLRKKVLKELGIINIENLSRNLINIWAYMTKKWLVMKKTSKDSNKSRWKTNRKWKVIQVADFDYQGIPSVRKRIIKGEKEKLLAQCSGLLTSIAALNGDRSITKSFAEVKGYLEDKSQKNNSTIEKEIDKKKKRFIKNESS